MKNSLKSRLKDAFNAPAPARKDMFLASADFPRTGRASFLLAQAGYIRKRMWAVSIFTAFISAAAAEWMPFGQAQNVAWLISSLLPLVTLVGITELARSASHKMAELEASCKHSLSNILLARLGALGAANILLLFAVALIFKNVLQYSFLRMGVYIFLPFLLTCALSLYALNRVRYADGVYVCAAVSVFVSALNGMSAVSFKFVYAENNVMFWAAACVCAFICMVFQTRQYMRKSIWV